MNKSKKSVAVGLLISTNHAHKKLVESTVCSKIGLHRTQHIILMQLAREQTLPSQKELAERMGITPAAITIALKKLESDGYIERSNGDDGRYNVTTITPLGLKIVEQTQRMFSDIDEAMFSTLTEDELDIFTELLTKIKSNLKTEAKKENSTENEKMV